MSPSTSPEPVVEPTYELYTTAHSPNPRMIRPASPIVWENSGTRSCGASIVTPIGLSVPAAATWITICRTTIPSRLSSKSTRCFGK